MDKMDKMNKIVMMRASYKKQNFSVSMEKGRDL